MRKTTLLVFVLFEMYLFGQSGGLAYQWTKQIGYGGGAVEFGTPIKVKKLAGGDVLIAGQLYGTGDFDPSPVRKTLRSYGRDIFVARYNSSNNLIWAFQIGGPQMDFVTALEVDNSGNIYIAGNFGGVMDFDPSPQTFTLASIGGNNSYFAKYSPTGGLIWAKALQHPVTGFGSDGVRDLKLDNLNNIVCTGFFTGIVDFDPSAASYTLVAQSSSDDYVAKFDNNGNFLWAKKFGFNNSNNNCGKLSTLPSGDIVIGGQFSFPAEDFDPTTGTYSMTSAGGSDAFFVKLDASGNFVWARQFGGLLSEQISDMEVDNNGYIVACGTVLQWGGLILKYDWGGNLIWSINNLGAGSLFNVNCSGVTLEPTGDVFVTGSFNGSGDFDSSPTSTLLLTSIGAEDAFVVKYTSQGAFGWAFSTGSNNPDYGSDVSFGGGSSVCVTGICTCPATPTPATGPANFVAPFGVGPFVAQFAISSGSLVSGLITGIGLGDDDAGRSITMTSNNNFIVAGIFEGEVDMDPSMAQLLQTSSGLTCLNSESDIFFSKFDANGNLLWTKTLGGSGRETLSKVLTDNMGNIYVIGTFEGVADFDPSLTVYTLTATANLLDVFFAKYDSLGNLIWAKNLSCNQLSEVTAAALDNSGNLFLSGNFLGTLNVDPLVATTTLTTGSKDVFFAKYNSSGNYLWAKRIGSGGNDFTADMVVDAFSNIYITGNFEATCDFDPSPSTAFLSDQYANGEAYLAKYDGNGNYLWVRPISSQGPSESGLNLHITSTGHVVLAGVFYASTATFYAPNNTLILTSNQGSCRSLFLSKYDLTGDIVFSKLVGVCQIMPSAIVSDIGNNIFLLGSFGAPNDFDPSVNSAYLNPTGYADMFIAKYDPSGNYINAARVGGSGGVIPNASTMDTAGNLYVTGEFLENVDFDPSLSMDEFLSYSNGIPGRDAFISKYYSCNAPAATSTPITSAINYCAGASAAFSVSPVYGAIGYNWSCPTGWISSASGNTLQATLVSSGAVSVSIQNGCGISSTGTLFVNVFQPPPQPVVSLTQTLICIGESFTVIGTGSVGSYLWSGPSNFVLTDSTLAFTATNVTQSGTYSLSSSMNYSTLVCHSAPTGVYIQVDACVGVNKRLVEEIILKPNPSSGNFTVYFGTNKNYKTIEIFDVSLQLVYSREVCDTKAEIDLSHLSNGIYYLRADNIYKKIVKN